MVGTVSKAVSYVCLLFLLVACSGDKDHQEGSGAQAGVSGPRTIVAAGDIADCDTDGDAATAKLVGRTDGTVLALGDNAYYKGSEYSYKQCYRPTWGRFLDRTRPVPGNHEYYTEDAEGYFDYFGEAAGDPEEGYYSYDLGAWHLVALNSNCEEVGGCDEGSPQLEWLERDLAQSGKGCTLAYFHHPLFTSGKHRPGVPEVRPLWEALYGAGADVVLSAHDHNYQRFAPQDPWGRADTKGGLRQFVVGTGGGEENYPIVDPVANTEAHDDDADGILELVLRPEGYDWRFVPVGGETSADSGSARCR